MKYIGIDIGDGESAVTAVEAEGAMLPVVLTLGSKQSIRSIVGMLKGSPVIGDKVMLDRGVTDRCSRFKSRFLTDAGSHEYIRRFAVRLQQLAAQSVHDTEVKIALGCPAAWKQEDREEYARIVSSAGFKNLYVVSESRAAFLYARHCNELQLSPESLRRPTLVIDIGSSTTDYAYIVDGRERDMGVFGEECLGGGILDELILEYAIEKSPQRERIEKVFAENPSWKSYCEIHARELKEEYFTHEDMWQEEPCCKHPTIHVDANTSYTIRIPLSGGIMNQLLDKPVEKLKGLSFRQAVYATLNNAKKLTQEHPVELLIITGGASRMKFFRDACSEVFPNANPAICNEPEFSIARGLGIAARTDDMLNRFRTSIADYFDSGAIHNEVSLQLPHLLLKYVPEVADILSKAGVAAAILNYPGNVMNSAQVDAYVNDTIAGVLKNHHKMNNANKVVDAWVGDKLKGVQAKLDELCERYCIDKADMSLVKMRANVPMNAIHVPLGIRVLVMLRNVPGLRSLIKWTQELPNFITNGDTLMERSLRKRLSEELSDPKGAFAKDLADQLVHELQQQINDQTEKVEIQIQ